MREKLKDLNIRITELSDYLGVSRPTLYKFLGFYEKGKYKNINKNILKLFRYIDQTPDIGKANVIAYILNNPDVKFGEDGGNETLASEAGTHSFDDVTSIEKSEFIRNVRDKGMLDEVIPYLNDCFKVFHKDQHDESELEILARFVLFNDDVKIGRKVTKHKIEMTKEIMRGGE